MSSRPLVTVAISHQSHPRPTGTSGSVVKDAWFVTASHPPLSNFEILSWADSHGSSVGPVNHVLRAIRGHISPESLAIRILVLRRGLECPPGPLGNRLTRRPTCRVVLFWKMSRPLIPPAIFQVSFSPTASLPLPFSMRANPDRLLLLLWRLHCLKKR